MKNFVFLVSFLVCATSYSQTKIGGVLMPNVVKIGENDYLKINGGGIREKLFMDLYIGVLYLREKSSSASTIINGDVPMAIKLRIISAMVSKENMEEAIRAGFDKSTGNNVSAIKDKIDLLIDTGFKEEIAIGDIFDLIYIPDKGVAFLKNDRLLLTITGLDFKKALFGIWLCDQPGDENLKNKMLGL